LVVLEQVRYALQAGLAGHSLFTVVPQLPFSAVPRHMAHGSEELFTWPGVVQYSLAHWLVHGPPLHTQLAMYWKNACEPLVQFCWQQPTQACCPADVPSSSRLH
jgi:hypothetical protein